LLPMDIVFGKREDFKKEFDSLLNVTSNRGNVSAMWQQISRNKDEIIEDGYPSMEENDFLTTDNVRS